MSAIEPCALPAVNPPVPAWRTVLRDRAWGGLGTLASCARDGERRTMASSASERSI